MVNANMTSNASWSVDRAALIGD